MNKNKLIEFASSGLPRATITISNGTQLTMRAFAVKELKLLMMSSESQSAQDTQIIQILNQCIETEGVDAKYLPAHDIEKMYIELYKISKGTSLIPVKYRCANTVGKKSCNTPISVNLNLNNVVVDDIPNTTIKLHNGLKLNMRFPNILEREYFNDEPSNIFNLAMRCIESIDTGHEVMVVDKDITPEELSEVIEYLDENSFEDLFNFVSAIPSITLSFPLKCPKCGHEEVITLRGLGDFFD